MIAGRRASTVPHEGRARLYSTPLLAICAVALLGFGSNFVIQPVLPLVVLAHGGDPTLAGLIIGAFSFPSVVLRPFMGRLVDETDRLFVLAVSLGAIAVAGVAYLIPSLILVFVNRVAHGAAWAGFNTAGHSTLAGLAPPDRRGEASGIYNLMPGIAQMVMPGLGLLLLARFGVLGPFLTCSVLALAGAAIVRLGPLRRSSALGGRRNASNDRGAITNPVQEVDVKGATIASREAAESKDRRFEPSLTGIRDSTAVAGRAELLDRGAIGPMLIELLFSLPFTLFLVFPPVFATLRGISVDELALYYPLYGGTLVIVRALAGRFLDRAPRTIIIATGSLLATVGLGVAATAESVPLLTLGGVLYGAAAAFTSPTTMALAIDRADPRRLGAAMATYTLGFQLAIGAGATLWGAIIDYFGYPAPYLVAIAIQGLLVISLRPLVGRYRGREVPLR